MKKQLESINFLIVTLIALVVLSFGARAGAQTVSNHKTAGQAEQAAGKGIIFKIPENLMPMEKWADIKGVLMLNLKQPAGAFVAYPNEGESLDELMNRIRTNIAPMFVHEKDVKFDWNSAALPPHEGDKTARMDLYKNDKQAVQIAFYQRENNGLPLVYGYFAMKNDKQKAKGIWLDEEGRGVKEFDKLWKSFPKK